MNKYNRYNNDPSIEETNHSQNLFSLFTSAQIGAVAAYIALSVFMNISVTSALHTLLVETGFKAPFVLDVFCRGLAIRASGLFYEGFIEEKLMSRWLSFALPMIIGVATYGWRWKGDCS